MHIMSQHYYLNAYYYYGPYEHVEETHNTVNVKRLKTQKAQSSSIVDEVPLNMWENGNRG